MMLNSTIILFYSNMLLGVTLSLSSNNWIMMWVGLEVSLMSFIPLMTSNLMISSECMIKYFIVQSMSSAIFILGVIFVLITHNFNLEIIIILSMMMKMGVAPFHSWILSIIEGLSYFIMFNLFSVMKIVPMMIISNLSFNLNLIIILTLVVGSIFGLNQNSLRSILSYSSIFNMGFLLYSSNNLSLWLVYFILYSINLLMMINILKLNNINYLNQFFINKMEMNIKLSIWILMLSSGGMPPLLGFMGKLMVIELSIKFNDLMMSIIMVITSLLTMFYYNRLCFILISISSLMMKWKVNYLSLLNLNIMSISLFMLPLFILMKYMN
uniref:NADH dehydrogenase subunit 2 n=1 Tax=Anidiocerus bimaculatus TaxID=3108262 RepID=UPI002E76A062|nr:NADH dehydrogenase subunit 2 [Anidiocerus bimaculatus]WQF69855.1 NADH dehydrogenase subunit 2 [Anidiocerus bimaculatus]